MLKANPAIALYYAFLNTYNQTLNQCTAPCQLRKAFLAKISQKGDKSIWDSRDILTFRLGFRKESRRGYSKKRLATEEKGGQLKRFRSGKGPCTSVSSISRRPLIVQEEISTGTFLGIMALLTTSSTSYKSFDGSTCCVVENSRTSDHSTVETRIKQGCVISGLCLDITQPCLSCVELYRKHTKLRILKSCQTAVLLYDVEVWGATSAEIETWIPENKRGRGRPKMTRRIVDTKRKDLGLTSWNEVEQVAKDSDGWKLLLCSLIINSPEGRGCVGVF